MQGRKEKRENSLVLYPEGEITIFNAQEVKSEIEGAREASLPNIVLNLEDIIYIDSSGVGMIVEAFFTIRAMGGSFRVCSLKDEIYDIFSSANLENTLEIDKTEAESIQAING